MEPIKNSGIGEMDRLQGTGAAYVRVSDDETKQTTTRQWESIETFEARHKVRIAEEYRFEDADWRRSDIDRRPAFQRMLKLADAGKIQWIVVNAFDRAAGKNKDDYLRLYLRLRDCGCQLIDTQGKDFTGGDLQSVIGGLFDAHTSESELFEKARRVIEGKTRLAKLGQWQGGHVPYGCDVVCLDGGKEVWRTIFDGRQRRIKLSADGTTERYDGKGRFPAHEAGQTLELRPSLDKAKLEAVKQVYDRYAHTQTGPSKLAKLLNDLGLKPTYSERWESWHIEELLRNPIYIGKYSLNKSSQAQYVRIVNGIAQTSDSKYRTNKSDQWAMSPELFSPIVDPKVWEKAQGRLATATKKRAPRSEGLYLSRLLWCQCGSRMRGVTRKNRHEYICSGYARKTSKCHRNTVVQTEVEKTIAKFLEDAGAKLDIFQSALTDPDSLMGKLVGRNVETALSFGEVLQKVVRYIASQPDWQKKVGNLRIAGDDEEVTFGHKMLGIEEAYRRVFAHDEPTLKLKLADLEAKYEKLVNGWADLPTVKAKELAHGKMENIEAEIEETKARLVNLADQMDRILAEGVEIVDRIEAATVRLKSSDGPAKAMALSKLIDRIEFEFQPTGHSYPHTRLVKTTIIPTATDREVSKLGVGFTTPVSLL